MNFVALEMLFGDRARYLGLVSTVAFSTFLMSHQSSVFAGVMERTTSQIRDISDANIWVMDPKTQYFADMKALADGDLYRIRGVEGIDWAVPLFKGMPRAKAVDGAFRVVIMMGVDDAALVRPAEAGPWIDRRTTAARFGIVDRAGYEFFFPGGPYELGGTLELNDPACRLLESMTLWRRFRICRSFYSRYSEAITYVGRERRTVSFVLARGAGYIRR